MDLSQNYLESTIKLFRYYKELGDKTISQLSNEELHWQHNEDSNSIVIIVKHIAGNMLSRWTDFLTSDGEKTWRQRDNEFIDDYKSREEMLENWEKGWACLFNALEPLKPEDMDTIVYIRNEGHTIVEAMNRQLAHYAHHVGQMVYVGKMLKGEDWQSLSIPRNKSEDFNKEKFSEEKR